MMNSKVMIGKDVISRVNFEQHFYDCKSVLVLYDLQGNICDIKYKLKKILPKDLKISFFKIKGDEYADVDSLNKYAEFALNNQTDLIIACGSDVAFNMGKALKFMLACGLQRFDTKFDNEKNKANDLTIKSIEPENTDIKQSETIKTTDIEKNKNINLICIAVASGNHQNYLTGQFEVFDKKADTMYRMNKQNSIADTIMLDNKMFDKMSDIAKLGDWLGSLFMALLAIANIRQMQDKVNAMAAIDILSVQQLSLVDLASAQMFAGYDFLRLKNNLLDEVILSIKKLTSAKYSLILVLIMRKNITSIIEALGADDIELLDCPFGISADNEKNWKEELCVAVQNKIAQYFEDKDIPCELNSLGVNSKQLEEIFDELTKTFGESENLAKLKDIVYSNY